MKDGAILCNTGHYDCEINIPELDERARGKRELRPNNEEYTLRDGERLVIRHEEQELELTRENPRAVRPVSRR